MPRIIAVESASICQLKCPECPTGRGENKTSEIGRGVLKFEKFKEIVDNNPWIRNISLVNWGEIFLNNQLPEIIKYAAEKKVILEAFGGVNFNTVSDAALEAMVKYGFGRLTISVDGATQESYSKYRVGGNIEDVFNNLRRLLEWKKIYKANHPVITWKYVIFGHNEADIPLAIRMAKEFGIPIQFKIQWDDAFSPVKDVENIKRLTGLQFVTQDEIENSTGRQAGVLESCANLWNMPMINWDGKLLGCCVNTWGTFGNVDFQDIESGINNSKMKYARKMLMGKAPEDASIPCTQCHNYKDFKASGNYLKESEVWKFNKTGVIRWIFGNQIAKIFMKDLLPFVVRVKRKL